MNIITHIQRGNEKAFTEVYQQYHAKLMDYFMKKTRSAETSIELVQIAFIKLWTSRQHLDISIPLDIQLFTIARSALIDYFRKQARKRIQISCWTNMTENKIPSSEAGDFESDDYFNSLIRVLPPTRKKVFTLNRLQGLSYKEIAEHLSISLNTVEDHMSKAMRQLRSLLSLFF